MAYSTLFWLPVNGSRGDVKTRRFRVFVGYSTLFWVPGKIFGARDPRYTVPGRRQNSSFSRFLAVFVGYSTLFWVTGTIFGARDRRYMVPGATSKLVVFAFSGRFRGL